MKTSAQVPAYSCFRPEFFRLSNPADRQRMAILQRSQSIAFVHDEIRAQLRELVKMQAPGVHSDPDGLDAVVAEKLHGIESDQYGVWVWYPWSRRLVHLLDEAEFAALRTARNQLKITAAEQTALQSKRIGIVGLSVGQSIALTLAMERGCGELRLADFDTLELSNMNRIRTGVHCLGLPKVVLAAREIAEIDPFLRVTIFPVGITESNIDRFFNEGGPLDLVFDECDSLDVKILLRHRARALGIPVLMDTNDRGMLDVERFDREPTRPILHGLAGDLDPDALRDLTTEQKVPFVEAIIGADTLSPRMKASMPLIGKSLGSWPQLASAVALGGALGADVSRRILLDQFHDSGRYYVDLDTLIADKNPSDAPHHTGDDNDETPRSALSERPALTVAKTNHLNVRAFRAPDEPHTCRLFVEGHRRALQNFGIRKLTSLNDVWKNNPDCVVVVAETPDGRLLGGIRFEKSTGRFALPVEAAVGDLDRRVVDLVRRHRGRGGIGEICGLWVSSDIKGGGLGTALIRYVVANFEEAGFELLAGFSSPHMLPFFEKIGWQAETGVGRNGFFEYPSPGIFSKVVHFNRKRDLAQCDPAERQKIAALRHTERLQERIETASGQTIAVRYERYRRHAAPFTALANAA